MPQLDFDKRGIDQHETWDQNDPSPLGTEFSVGGYTLCSACSEAVRDQPTKVHTVPALK
uniref:Uncharacterized protein n=1 Tax=Melanopsichium pennsylvanicum 4 TaxID=1398559 RepID=A0A077R609_9BASI|nr:uncharacterized protein BN887_06160 [Melanopsichium pennsylvanicum 4]